MVKGGQKVLASERTKDLLSRWRRVWVDIIGSGGPTPLLDGLLDVRVNDSVLTGVTSTYSEAKMGSLTRHGGRVVEVSPLTLEEILRCLVDVSRASTKDVDGA